MLGHHVKIILELIDQVLHFGIFNLNNERIGQLCVLGTYHKVICLGDKHLYRVNSIA